MKEIFKHELYTDQDFTPEEYEQRNLLAVQVIDYGFDICKKCGKGESELTEPCELPKAKRIRLQMSKFNMLKAIKNAPEKICPICSAVDKNFDGVFCDDCKKENDKNVKMV